MDVFMVCSSIQLLDWSSGLGRRCRMFSGVRSFSLVRVGLNLLCDSFGRLDPFSG